MSTNHNVTIEYDTRANIDEQLLDAFAPYHPATGRSVTGNAQVIITVPAEDVVQMLHTTAALLARELVAPVVAVEIITTDEFDRRNGLQPIPQMLSVTEAAAAAGVTRQAILQRLESGSLAGQKVGTTWAVQASAVEAAFERHLRSATTP